MSRDQHPSRVQAGVPTGGQFAPSSHPESTVELSAPPAGRSSYDPYRRLVGAPSPQNEPDQFSNEDIRAEVKYLMALDRRHGSHPLRTSACLRLLSVIDERQTGRPAGLPPSIGT
jgi:hypothetical protein